MVLEWFLRTAVGFWLLAPIVASYIGKGGLLGPSTQLNSADDPIVADLCRLAELAHALAMLLIAAFGPTRFYSVLLSELGNEFWFGHVPLPKTLQMFGGFVLLVASVLTAWPRIALGYCLRIPREDRVLGQHFGEQWLTYRNSTPALIPRF